MSARLSPAFLAVGLGAVLVLALFVPYVARQYRRRGELGFGHAALSVAGLLYALGLLAYISVPMPVSSPDFCALHGVAGPQLRPLQFLNDMRKDATGTGLTALLHNPALTQVLLNIALFVPLGMLVRYMFHRGVVATTVIGFAVSLFIEVTQLTGMWFLLPCPYRLFDVDDLTANTLGALLGASAAPVLGMLPGQRTTGLPPGAPRPVTAGRRLLGMICDLVAFQLLVVLVGTAFRVLLLVVDGGLPGFAAFAAFAEHWLPWILLFVLIPLAGNGAGLGQRVVQLGAVTRDGTRPAAGRRLARSLAGVGGYLLLWSSADLPAVPALLSVALWGLTFVQAAASLIGIWATRDRRGLSYALTGLKITDVRSASETARASAR
jgi:VanZ like family/RDD family